VVTRPLVDFKVSHAVDKYYRTHPEKCGFLVVKLKERVQTLINELALMAESSESIRARAVTLYNVDYEGIEIIRRPRLLDKRYSVKLKLRDEKKKTLKIEAIE
jgi:hypothetical protein